MKILEIFNLFLVTVQSAKVTINILLILIVAGAG
jgi:hypothetical protein